MRNSAAEVPRLWRWDNGEGAKHRSFQSSLFKVDSVARDRSSICRAVGLPPHRICYLLFMVTIIIAFIY